MLFTDFSYKQRATYTFDLTFILNNYKLRYGDNISQYHGGFITKGDNFETNYNCDQIKGLRDRNGNYVEPVKVDWVIGKARGELPWYGSLKLYFQGKTSTIPSNSWTYFFVSLGVILVVPFVIDVVYPQKVEDIQERKKELLLKLSQLDREDFKEHLELVEEVKGLHEEVKALLLNNISFLGELFKELSNNETYAKRSSPSFFKGNAAPTELESPKNTTTSGFMFSFLSRIRIVHHVYQ